MSDEDRITVSVRLTPQQHELLRRRCLSDGVNMQTVLSAGVNAYVLGDLRVRANGRYFVEGPRVPSSREDEVPLRAPTPEQPERVVTITQPTAQPRSRRSSGLTTSWLVEHLHQRTGKKVSARMLRLLLAHMEERGMVEPREGRYWKFTGDADPRVVAVVIAMDDGTYDEVVAASMGNL